MRAKWGTLAVFAALALATPASAASRSYILKRPRHEHCRVHYVRKIKRGKVHHRTVRQVWCVHVPLKLSPAPATPAPAPTPAPSPAPPKGGQRSGVNAVAGPVVVSGFFEANYSGFGLKPGTVVFACDTYSPSRETRCAIPNPEVAADGTFSVEEEPFPCHFRGSKVSNLFVQAITAGGVFFTREFPPPAAC